MYIQQAISQKYATKLGGRTSKSQNLGIELQKYLFYRLLKINFFNAFGRDLVQLTQFIKGYSQCRFSTDTIL